ncbi:Uncharacterised protein [Vibrio cholerae]|nr:Uncharacterised protein [Vibrio cholerae]
MAGQIGRQKIPVVLTATKKRPSNRGSRLIRARWHTSADNSLSNVIQASCSLFCSVYPVPLSRLAIFGTECRD